MARTVTWLHLSDLHACNIKSGWDANKVLKTLQTDLLQMQNDYGLQPDMIFFTGDAAYGHLANSPGKTLADQYREVHRFFEQLRTTFRSEVPRDKLFIVPGNHDVNREARRDPLTLWLDQTDTKGVTNMIQSGNNDWCDFMRRLSEYRDFLKGNGYSHLLGDPDRLMYSVTHNINGVDIRVVGLNCAWSCGRDEEKTQIWTGGDWQIGHLAAQRQNAHFSVVLTHHPTDWFVDAEHRALRRKIKQDFHFHLHGHEHEGWVEHIPDENHTRIAAAACYEQSDTQNNGYNIVHLNMETGEGTVWLRQYDSLGGGWIPRVICRRTDNDGRWPLNLDWVKRLNLQNPEMRPAEKVSPSQQGFQLKTTIVKQLISENRIGMLKLRTLKADQEVRRIAIDTQPKISGNRDKTPRRARVPDYYSLPGRASKTPENDGMFQIDFGEDEVLLPGREYAVLIGYTMDENIQDAFDPPGIIARQPVGSESLVIEVHFPRGWHFRRNLENKAIFALYMHDQTRQKTDLSAVPGVTVKWLTHDFGHGDTDYFRVKIIKPPQDADIFFDWEWEREGSTETR